MGCGLTKPVKAPGAVSSRKRSETAPLSVDDLKNRLLDEYKHVQKRFGNPSIYKNNGYELGLRYDGFERAQSFYAGTSYANQKKVTIKEHHLACSLESNVIQEVLILANLSHKCLPEMYEVFITDSSVYTVSSYIDSQRLTHLFDMRALNPTPFSVNDIRSVFRQIVEAVAHCHSKNVIVRNLTASNICCKKTSDGYAVKIADFSLSVMQGCTEYLCDSKFFNWSQVPYMAPEALLGSSYGPSMDMWGAGVLLYLMVCNCLPFANDEDSELMSQITNAKFECPKHVAISSATKYLISQCLFTSPSMRLTTKEALANSWLSVAEEESASAGLLTPTSQQ